MNAPAEVSLWRLTPLVVGAFAIGVDASVLSGILLAVSSDLGTDPSTVGQALAVFPLVFAIGAPIVASLVAGQSQRRIGMAGLLLFSAGNLVAMSGSVAMLVAGRLIAAIGACAYLPNATATAGASVPSARSGRAVSLVLSGVTAATVIGVPLGVLVSSLVGWRWVLVAIAVMGVVAALLQGRGGLADPRTQPVPIRERLRLLGQPGLLVVLALTLLAVAGEYVVYSYLALVVRDNVGAGTEVLMLMLTVLGVGTLIGTIAGGVLSDRFRWRPLLATTVTTVGLLLLVLPVASGLVATLVVLFAWGVVGWTIVPTQLKRLLSVYPSAGTLVVSLNSSSVFLGAALGGLVGARVIDGYSTTVLCVVGAVGVWCSLIFLFAAARTGADKSPGRDRSTV
ncbi:MFS transporter [Umezawaea endophytica]|uniref:MFS transporter n=1 Tax=Umezawaea endophytica TaxID=1654476 RepID=A0A9X2VTG7_9PSEU|nr:MFS transporter [Umezawaea endophytica]MCS7482450.1 MFS transporter [Umezawaea endophytica]